MSSCSVVTVVKEVVDLEGSIAVGDAAEVLEPTHRGAEGAAPGPAHQVHHGAAGRGVDDVLAGIVNLVAQKFLLN